MKNMIMCLIVVAMVLSLSACQKKTEVPADVLSMEWEQIIEAADGSTVNFYGWGGSQQVNTWLDSEVSTYLMEHYNVTLNRVPMNIDDILNKLIGEQQLESEGTIDIVWINGENFSTAKSNNLLFGPFTNKLPHFNTYIDSDSLEVQYDFGFEIEGYEAPYGKAQFVMIGDDNRIENYPKGHKELLEFAMENPGKVTYPAPPDFTGSAFVRNIVYDILGQDAFLTLEADKESVRTVIQPALDYLLEMKPYLWKNGESYPATVAQLDNMYADGEVMMTMSYNPNHVAGKINTGEFPASSNAYVFDKGTVGNTHFLAIPQNAPNNAAALVLINSILSPELQASKYDPSNWGDLPVLDNNKLSVDEKALFESVPVGAGVPSQEELLGKRVPEMPVQLIPIIEELWLETIPGKVE